MNNVRQGILSRPVKQDFGRNKTTLDTQHKQEVEIQSGRTQLFNNINEHRRAAFDGSRNEKQEIKTHQMKEIDFLKEAKSNFNERAKQLNDFETSKNYQHYLEGKRREEQAREAKREYERQMMNQNRKMIQEKNERQNFDKQFSNYQESRNLLTDFNKKSSDYR